MAKATCLFWYWKEESEIFVLSFFLLYFFFKDHLFCFLKRHWSSSPPMPLDFVLYGRLLILPSRARPLHFHARPKFFLFTERWKTIILQKRNENNANSAWRSPSSRCRKKNWKQGKTEGEENTKKPGQIFIDWPSVGSRTSRDLDRWSRSDRWSRFSIEGE